MIITVSQSYIPLRYVEINTLNNPITGQKENMLLVLYQKRIDTNFSTTLKKKLKGVYTGADGAEIPSRYWTQAMKDVFHQEQKVITDLHTGIKLRWTAWIFIIIGLILCFSLVNDLYKTWQSLKSQKTQKTEIKTEHK